MYTVPAEDALSTRPLIGLIEEVWILRIISRFFRPFAVKLRLLAKTFIPFDSAFFKPNVAALHLGIGQISLRDRKNKLNELAEYAKSWCSLGNIW